MSGVRMFKNGIGIEAVVLSPDKYYLNDLVKKGVLAESELRNIPEDKNFICLDGKEFLKIVEFLKSLNCAIIPVADGYERVIGFLEYPSIPVSKEKSEELEKAYFDRKLISTGRAYIFDNFSEAVEFYYEGKLYARSRFARYDAWYDVTFVDYIIDYNTKRVFSTRALIPDYLSSESESFTHAIVQQLEPNDLFAGDSDNFNLSSGQYTIVGGSLRIPAKSCVEYIPYGVKSVIMEDNAYTKNFLVFPKTVQQIDFAYEVMAGKVIDVDCIDLCDNVLFGKFIKFNVNDKVVVHYHDAETLMAFLEQMSNHIVNRSRNADFGNIFQKMVNKLPKNNLKLLLELRGPKVSLTKDERKKISSYGFNYYFSYEEDYRSVPIPDIFMEDTGEEKESKNVFQEMLNEVRNGLKKYIGYYLDGDKRLSDFDNKYAAVSAVMHKFKSDDGKVTEEEWVQAKDAFLTFINNWKDKLKEYENQKDYYEVIDYIDKCIGFLDGKSLEYDGEFLTRFVQSKRKSELVDSKTASYFKLIAKEYLSSEKKLVQEFIGKAVTDSAKEKDTPSASIPELEVPLLEGKADTDSAKEKDMPCASIPELETTLLGGEFSKLFDLINLAAETKGIKDEMVTDLWHALSQTFDEANKKYTSYFKETANGIVKHIRELAANATELMKYRDRCGDIIKFFSDSSAIDDTEEFKAELINQFPDLFPDDDRAAAFERAYGFCEPVVPLGNPELVKLNQKYAYMTAALMKLETVLAEQAKIIEEFKNLLNVTLPPKAR